MICKWCGGALERREAACKRCGRQAPPLSDCGGFYDLVPETREDIPAASLDGASTASHTSKLNGLLAVLCVILVLALGVSLLLCGALYQRSQEQRSGSSVSQSDRTSEA